MKTLATITLALGLTMRLYAAPLLTDVATYEAAVIDDATGNTLAAAGPWAWEEMSSQKMLGQITGTGRTIIITCRNAEGDPIFGGMITGADLTVPWSPFEPPNPLGIVSLTFFTVSDTIAVYLNDRYFVGDILLLPAQYDVLSVVVDIKPGTAVAPFNVKSKGLLPVAILGASEVDVNEIDPSSITLAGIKPVRYSVADIQNDGFADLLLHFRDQEVAGVLAGVADGEVVGLELTGTLQDGRLIKGSDSIKVILKPGKN